MTFEAFYKQEFATRALQKACECMIIRNLENHHTMIFESKVHTAQFPPYKIYIGEIEGFI